MNIKDFCGCVPITEYNASNACNQPTILQQVNYLIGLLKKYPAQQFFISTDKVTKDTIKIATIKNDNNRQINAGDFIFANTVSNGSVAGNILMFSYTGAKDVNGNYIVDYVGTFSADNDELATIRGEFEQLDTEVSDLKNTVNNPSTGLEATHDTAVDAQTRVNDVESEVAAVKVTANNAYSLSQTNETDIGTLDGQVAVLETKTSVLPDEAPPFIEVIASSPDNKMFYIPLADGPTSNTIAQRDSKGFLHSKTGGSIDDNTLVVTMDLYNIHTQRIDNLSSQIRNLTTYRHNITLNVSNSKDSFIAYASFYSYNSLNCDSLTDLKTLLGESFSLSVSGYLNNKDTSGSIIVPVTFNSTQGIITLQYNSSNNYQVFISVFDFSTITISDNVEQI